MRAILSKTIPVTQVAVFAELAFMERRPELGLLCRAARESAQRITNEIIQSALPGLSDAGATNVLRWCEMLGLCDRHGGLTRVGDDVADSDEAPVPEQGVYHMWLARHPVFGYRVLAVKRLSSTREQRVESLKVLGEKPDLGKLFRSVVDPNERFIVRSFPANQDQTCCILGSEKKCRLQWTLDFEKGHDRWHLDDGTIDGKPFQHQPESDGLDLWKLVENWATGPLAAFGEWQSNSRLLSVRFYGLSQEEYSSFFKKLELGRVQVPGKGTYENVTLQRVPIGPATERDAQQWAMARFDSIVGDHPSYRSRSEVRRIFAQCTEDTPIEPFAPKLPSHAELLARAEQHPETFWALAAPVDLAPFPIAAEDLAELRIKVPETRATGNSDTPGLIRVPYRGGWSMRQLTDRLLDGTTPMQVLLCDRYVRGDNNLAALKLLVESFRLTSPKLPLEIWTDDGEADLKSIKRITGVPPKTYRQVFGRNTPHDRYLLVRPNRGAGFGWHMSNSPLHARADIDGVGPEAQLRWKDLAAARVSTEQLRPEFRQWLAGGRR